MAGYDFDLITIGAGSGGVAASRRSAILGARVAICESDRVGGTCVIRGCVPKKLLMYGAQFRDYFEDAAGYGWGISAPEFSWEVLLANKNKEIERLSKLYRDGLDSAGVTLLQGRGRLTDPHTIEVSGRTYTASTILIATGAVPSRLPLPGIEYAITSDDLLELTELPKSMIIIGGGYIAVEFASILQGLGIAIQQVIRADHILRGFDDDLRKALEQEMARRGIVLHRGVDMERIEATDDGYQCLVARNGRIFQAQNIMVATGRSPNIQGLGLEDLGIEIGRQGEVKVDEWSCTSLANVYAIGDVAGRKALTPIAIAEGRAIAETLYSNHPNQVCYDNIPTAVFSSPHLGTVGFSEAEAIARGHQVDIYQNSFRALKHAISGRDERTVIKLVVDSASGQVLGCHMLGNDAPEIIQALAIALNCGATKSDFDRTISLHPTAAEEFVTLRKARG